jgi:IclR family transcriptional regulator, KDG regulon repressor
MNNTLLKGLAVLELLSRSDRPLNLTQIGRELGMVKSNVHRLMLALVETHFVLRDEDTGHYTASIKLWELGSAVLGKLDLRRHAERQMEALMSATSESVHLSVLDGLEVVYVHKVDSPNPVRAYTQIGGRAPAYCVATGKAQLAFSGSGLLQEIAGRLRRHTEHTVTDPEAFLRELRKVREQGWAVNRAEWRDNVWGVAAPIKDARGSVIAALGVSGPAERFRKTKLQSLGEAVVAAANDVAYALGGRLPAVSALSRVRLNAD